MIKLAVRKEEGSIPGGGFHYIMLPRALELGDVDLWRALGFIIIEVEEVLGLTLIADAEAALHHQMQVAQLVDGKKNRRAK